MASQYKNHAAVWTTSIEQIQYQKLSEFVQCLGTDHYFFGGGGDEKSWKNCLQNQKSPNKLFADMKRRK